MLQVRTDAEDREKATERCLRGALPCLKIQMKTNDRGLKQWQYVTF